MSFSEAHHALNTNRPAFVDEMEISRIETENKVTYGEAKRIRKRQCPVIPKVYITETTLHKKQNPQREKQTQARKEIEVRKSKPRLEITQITQKIKPEINNYQIIPTDN